MERAHPRSGDNHTPDMIVGAVTHPDTPHAAAYLHGRPHRLHRSLSVRASSGTDNQR